MIDVTREPNLTLWDMMTTPLLAEAMKSMIRGVGMGELNIISIHLIAGFLTNEQGRLIETDREGECLCAADGSNVPTLSLKSRRQ